MKTTKLSNAIARKFFLHDNDRHEDGSMCCYFSERPYDESGWGFWVRSNGEVDVDTVSANGEMPSRNVVEACKRAAVKYLSR